MINCNEAGAWRYLAYQHTSRPSSRLAAALGGRDAWPADHAGPIASWDAHHIIPTKDNADNAARGYACFNDNDAPNKDENGVLLRGFSVRAPGESRLQPAAGKNYSRLKDFDSEHGTGWHKRQYHPSLRTGRYFAEVNRRLGRFTSASLNWWCDKDGALNELTDMRKDLIRGDFPF